MKSTLDRWGHEVTVEPWVEISIVRRTKFTDPPETLHVYNLPRRMLEKWRWVIDWRVARFKCKTPRDQILTYHCFYDKKTGFEMNVMSVYAQYVSAKAWLTKARKALDQYIEIKKGELFQDLESDPKYRALKVKVQAKVEKLERLRKQLDEMKPGWDKK